MTNNKVKLLTTSAILLSVGLILPFITMQIPTIGVMLSPMHIPVLLAGFVVGPTYGFLIGLILPVLRGLLFSIPRFPNAIYMAFELATYGLITGLVFNKKYNYSNIYLSLILSMIAGRIVYGLVKLIAFKYVFNIGMYGLALWITDVFVSSIPGIIIQLLFIPLIVMTLHKRGIIK